MTILLRKQKKKHLLWVLGIRGRGVGMKENTQQKYVILLYGFLFGYILSFIFEGGVYEHIGKGFSFDTSRFVLPIMLFHMLGLLTQAVMNCYVNRSKGWLQYFIYIVCIVSTPLYGLGEYWLCGIAMMIASFTSGCAVAYWGTFYKKCFPKNQRIKAITKGLIIANILMMVANIVAGKVSSKAGFTLSIAYLVAAFFCFIKVKAHYNEKEFGCQTDTPDHQEAVPVRQLPKYNYTIAVLILFLYVLVINIDSGLMYDVINRSYESLGQISDWYWAIPYIGIIFLLYFVPNEKFNYSRFLYLASVMIAAAFVLYLFLDVSTVNYLLTDTLLLAAIGILDVTWAGKLLGDEMDHTIHPVMVFACCLSANIGGVFLGGLIGTRMIQYGKSKAIVVVFALLVVCISLIILPSLLGYMQKLFQKEEAIVSDNLRRKEREEAFLLQAQEPLTKREEEIFKLILSGDTNEEISDKLNISKNTVKTHVRNVLAKYNVSNRTELMSKVLHHTK